jgi:hypothetical protein
MRNDFEHQEQVALFMWANTMDAAHKHPALSSMFAIPNGGARHIAVALKLKAEGVKAGVPDIFLPWRSGEYAGLFIELKADGGKISPAQQAWNKFLNIAGYRAEFCFGWIAAAKVICEYLNLDAKACGVK